jgi:hypothetical protein
MPLHPDPIDSQQAASYQSVANSWGAVENMQTSTRLIAADSCDISPLARSARLLENGAWKLNVSAFNLLHRSIPVRCSR